MSIGESEVVLSDRGNVSVIGSINGSSKSNGSGKSSIFESIVWVFTGSTMRGSSKVVNRYMMNPYAEVTVELTKDDDLYSITRTLDHPDVGKSVTITKNGENISGNGLRKSEQVLSEEFDGVMTRDNICSLIVLGQGLPSKLSSLTPASRRNRLSALTNIDESLNSLTNSIKDTNNEISKEIVDVDLTIAKDQSAVDTLTSSNVRYQRSIDDLVAKFGDSDIDINKVREDIVAINNDIEKLNESLVDEKSSLSELEEKKSILFKEFNDLGNEIYKIRSEGSKLFNEKEKLSHSTICPTCGAKLVDKSQLDTIKKNIIEIDTKMSNLLGSMNSKKESYDLLSSTIASLDNDIANSRNRINGITNAEIAPRNGRLYQLNNILANSDAPSKIASYRSEIDTNTKSITELKSSLESYKSDKLALTKELDSGKYVYNVARKELPNYLLNGILEYMNERYKYYTNRITGDTKSRLEVDEKSIYIIYQDKDFDTCSGGERQVADISLQLAIRDMVGSVTGLRTNLLVIDEGYDNLDTESSSGLTNLLVNDSLASTLFIVTHHKDLDIATDSTILVEKDITGVSTIKDDYIS